MTFGEWIDFWYQNYCKIRIKESTQEDYETRIYNHIIPKIGKIPLNELTQNDLQKFYNSLKKDGRLRYRETLGEGLSDRFVRSCHANCRTALQRALRGSVGQHQMQMLKFQHNHIDFLTRSIEEMDLEVKKTEKIAEYISLLDEIFLELGREVQKELLQKRA